MELSKTQKILLAIGSVWPVLYILIFFIFVFGMFALSDPKGGGELNPAFGIGFLLILVVHIFTILLSLALTVFYIIHAVKNSGLEPNMRIVWIVLFFFAGMIAEPIYWYLEIWREKPAAVANVQLPPQSAGTDSFQDFRSGTYVPPIKPPDWR